MMSVLHRHQYGCYHNSIELTGSRLQFRSGLRMKLSDPAFFVVQAISWLWPIRATIRYAQDNSERTYSPMILTNTRFRRRPSNSP